MIFRRLRLLSPCESDSSRASKQPTINPKTHPLSVEEFMKCGFLASRGKSAGNTVRINEHLDDGKAEIRLHKSWFKLL
jgi:hypothetical protein